MRDANTKANFIAWYRDVFGFTLTVFTTPYGKQLLRNKKTLAELDDNDFNNICRMTCRDPAKPIAEVAAAQLKKLAIFRIKHQDQTLLEIGILAKPLVWVTLASSMTLKEQKQLEDGWLKKTTRSLNTPI